jgi:hypothetical protein
MVWTEIGADGIWTIPAERYKTKRSNHVPLSNAALAVIEAQPKVEDCDYVFPSQVKTPFSGFGKSKARLDKAVLLYMQKHAKKKQRSRHYPTGPCMICGGPQKTLMARAACAGHFGRLGHVIAGVEGNLRPAFLR